MSDLDAIQPNLLWKVKELESERDALKKEIEETGKSWSGLLTEKELLEDQIYVLEKDRDLWKQKCERLRVLIQTGINLMERINGPDDHCVMQDIKYCSNHQWLSNCKQALVEVEGK